MINIFNDFCLCDVSVKLKQHQLLQPMFQQEQLQWRTGWEPQLSLSQLNQSQYSAVPAIGRVPYICQKQVKTIHTYDFSKHQQKLKAKLYPLLGTGLAFATAKKKANLCKSKKVSKRRSKYTGVTKNSINYQTLIVIGGKKTYVGSFPLELDAAITFDFYSMMLHSDKAPTNFAWKAEDILEMVESFNLNRGVFEPARFHSKLINSS
ncbi:unnamed protein product [Moneuplotes crassus]|uniref:Uncharacterized protein n=1 Tax=Euplotes crassus TaxID=5936 RepID=A0AAD1Y7A2_EUPCR|nr:unnamed protein product [Moneuplotes crassus]